MAIKGFPIVLSLGEVPVALIGRDERRVAALQEAGARVTVFDTLPELQALAPFRLLLVKAGISGAEAVRDWARQRGVLFWIEDDWRHSDFTMPAVAQLGPAQIMISTGGESPSLARRMREIFERTLGAEFGRFVAALGQKRAQLSTEERKQMASEFYLEITPRYPKWFK
jgi:siroheme synthase (precorrin-2 oxidase/ferrochelatase)